MYFARRHLPWIASAALGSLLLVAGLVLLTQGMAARNQIRDELRAEQVYTSADADPPGVLVEDAETAQAQAEAIKRHTLGTWGPFSSLPPDDARRVRFVDGVALRTALNTAVMGFRITELVMGTGVIVLLAGIATLALATPGLYFLAGAVVDGHLGVEHGRAEQGRGEQGRRAA